mgnify:CR=1 FL=1
MESANPAQLGFAHFIAQADGLAHALLVVLLAMSVITWYLIVSKSIANRRMKKHAEAFKAVLEKAAKRFAALAKVEARHANNYQAVLDKLAA